MQEIDRLELRYEVARKVIHLSSLSIPVIYCHITRDLALLILIPLFAGFFLVDLLKNFNRPVSQWYHKTFDSILREHELKGETIHLNGATWIAMSALLMVLFFPKVIAITAFSMVAVSDTVAAIVGKAFGRHRFGGKSMEGSAAFFLSSMVIVSIVPGLHPVIGYVMAAAATLTEAFMVRIVEIRIDDNLSIPLVSASVGMGCYMLFMPEQIAFLSMCR